MKRAALVLLAACGHAAAPRPAAHNEAASPGDPRDYELGHGVARDYAKALELYRTACNDGHGDAVACRKLGLAIANQRGSHEDNQAAGTALGEACHAGDLPACLYGDALGMSVEHGDLAGPLTTACDGGDADSCQAALTMIAYSQAMSDDCDAHCQEQIENRELQACHLGSLRICIDLVQKVFESCTPDDTACATQAEGEAPAPFQNAVEQVRAACDAGDADACKVIPGRRIPEAELCAAHDYAACDR